MAYQPVDIGSAPNDGTGDPIRDAFDKVNDNFVELYAGLTGLLDFKGSTDCSANPNYPAASKGDTYMVSVAGKIGGASGKTVEVGDFYLALADNAGGTEASVGTSWAVLQGNITSTTPTDLDDLTDVNAPSPANGDVLTWDSTPGEWIASAPTGGSITELDDVPDVNAPTPSDGDVLTWDSTPGEWVAAAPTGGSYTAENARDDIGAALVAGSGMTVTVNDGSDTITLAATGIWRSLGGAYTAAGVWDQSLDGSVATIDFTGLAGATDIRIIMKGVTKGTTGTPLLTVSVNNGSTYYSASGDYVFLDTSGVETAATSMTQGHLTNATAARSCVMEIQNANKPLPVGLNVTVAVSHRLFAASTSPINAVRITPSGGGNFTGGKVYCLVR